MPAKNRHPSLKLYSSALHYDSKSIKETSLEEVPALAFGDLVSRMPQESDENAEIQMYLKYFCMYKNVVVLLATIPDLG